MNPVAKAASGQQKYLFLDTQLDYTSQPPTKFTVATC